jgi:hypothetical protein
LVFDLTATPAPAAEGGVWGSLREVGGWWGALRFLPSAIRQAFSEREPVGGLPIVEPGHTRPAELAEVDFNPGAPTGDHTPAAQTPAAEAQAAEAQAAEAQAAEQPGAEFTVEESLAGAATVEAGVEPVAADVVHEVFAEPLVADVAEVVEVAFAEASIGEVGAELGEAGLEAGL